MGNRTRGLGSRRDVGLAWTLVSIVAASGMLAAGTMDSEWIAASGIASSGTTLAATSGTRAPRPNADRAGSGFHRTTDGRWTARQGASDVVAIGGRVSFTHPRVDDGMAIETRSVHRGRDRLGRPATTSVGRAGELRLDRRDFVETIAVAEAGTEQAWEFAEEPSGVGDLVVEVSVDGPEFVASDAGGLHFSGPRGGYRYGHATWVDARGRRTDVPSRFVDGAVNLLVPASVLAESAYPAVLDPIIGAEFALDAPAFVPLDGLQDTPMAAFDGTHYRVIWIGDGSGGSRQVFGTRVSATGDVVDESALLITPDGSQVKDPQIACGTSGCLVVYTESANGTVGIYANRLGPQGELLDPQRIVVAHSPGTRTMPRVTWSGTEFVVVWSDQRNFSETMSDIYAARVTTAGIVREPNGKLIVGGSVFQTFPDVASDGNVLWLTWQDSRNGNLDVFASRLSSDLAVIAGSEIPVAVASGMQTHSDIAVRNGEMFVVYSSESSSAGLNVLARRFSSTGASLDSAPIVVCAAGGDQLWARAVWDGTGYAIAWRDPRAGATHQTFAARVSATGALLDSPNVPISATTGNAGLSAIASSGNGSLVVYADSLAGGGQDVLGAMLPAVGGASPDGGILVSRRLHEEIDPSIAFDGTNYLYVWTDTRTGALPVVRGMRVSQDGSPIDSSVIAISSTPGSRDPEVVFLGSNYLVVFVVDDGTNARAFHYRFVSPTGALDARAEAPILGGEAPRSNRFALVSRGDEALLVWTKLTGGSLSSVVFDGNGPSQSATNALVPADHAVSDVDVAFDGSGYRVVFDRSTGTSSTTPFAIRVGLDGVPTELPVPLATGDGSHARVACAMGSCVATFVASVGSPSVVGVVISDEGQPASTEPTVFGPSAAPAAGPELTFDGTNYLVAWVESGPSAAFASRVISRTGFPNGAVVRAETTGAIPTHLSLALGARGRVATAYSRDTGDRLRARIVCSSGPEDTTCDQFDDDCDGLVDEDACGIDGPDGGDGSSSGRHSDGCSVSVGSGGRSSFAMASVALLLLAMRRRARRTRV